MDNTFTMVRNPFLARSDLTETDKLVLIYLAGRVRKWDVNREQIAGALGLGVHPVRDSLARLREAGWVTDNRKPVRGKDGRTRRVPSRLVESRRHDVVLPPKDESVPWHQRTNTTVGKRPSNEGQSYEGLSHEHEGLTKGPERPLADSPGGSSAPIKAEPIKANHNPCRRARADASADTDPWANAPRVSADVDELDEIRAQRELRRERQAKRES